MTVDEREVAFDVARLRPDVVPGASAVLAEFLPQKGFTHEPPDGLGHPLVGLEDEPPPLSSTSSGNAPRFRTTTGVPTSKASSRSQTTRACKLCNHCGDFIGTYAEDP